MMEALSEFRSSNVERRAFDLMEHLRSTGGASAVECCEALKWRRGQFDSALAFGRETLCPAFGVTIPHAIPDDGFRYHLTGEWVSVDGTPAIAAGTAYALGQIEARLRSVQRDVRIALQHLDSRSVHGRKANYLNKHLTRIFETLGDIDGGSRPQAEGVA